jgi:hypothetical protein
MHMDFSIPVSDRWDGESNLQAETAECIYYPYTDSSFFLFFLLLVGLRTQCFNLHEQSQ